MKQFALIAITAAIMATPSLAQNASQIARVQNGASCSGCNLFQADLTNRELKGKNYARARLRQADLSLGDFNRSNFSGTDMRDVNATGALFSGSSFVRANLMNATFVGAYLEGANFAGANLSGVNFSGAEMRSTRGITQHMMDRACGDASTVPPRGIRIPVCE